MSFFNSMNISASGLTAQRLRMDVISSNIANINTTRTGDGGPFRRRTVLMQEQRGALNSPFSMHLDNFMSRPVQGYGVRVTNVLPDMSEGPRMFEPSHPDADEDGYVQMPNVNVVTEMVNMIAASRSYEANITAISTTRAMLQSTLGIGAR